MVRPRRSLGALFLLSAVLLAACDEERMPNTGPGSSVLTGNNLYFSALVSTGIYAFHNAVAEFALLLVESGETNAQIVPSCIGDGQMIGRPVGPGEWQFVFDDFGIFCDTFLPLTINSDTCETGGMFVHFEEIAPGLRYTISMPMRVEILGEDAFGNPITRVNTDGLVYQIPSEFGNAIFAVTTPGRLVRDGQGNLIEEVLNPDSDCELRYAVQEDDFMTCELEPAPIGGRAPRTVHQSGTIRIEDRTQTLLIVQELALDYVYDDERILLERYDPYPSGSYEIAIFASLGFQGAVASLPTEVQFDGGGGATFFHAGLECNVNFLTQENPCEGL